MRVTLLTLFLLLNISYAESEVDVPVLSNTNFEQKDYYYSVLIQYPLLSNCVTKEKAKVCEKFNKNIFKFAQKQKKAFSKSKLKKKREAVDKLLRDKEILPQKNIKHKFFLKITYDAHIINNETISVLFKIQDNDLSEHGTISFSDFHYDINKQREIKFNKVFQTKKDKMKALSTLAENYKPNDSCLTTKASINKKHPFLMTEQNYIFAFAPYELGPYKCGSVLIKIPKSDLVKAAILK